jgi:hypothetical protein
VQSEELVIRLCRGQLEEPILGSDRQDEFVFDNWRREIPAPSRAGSASIPLRSR